MPVPTTNTATSIAGQPDQPWLTLSTAMQAAATPLTTPTDRSISPSSSTSTTPTAMMPSGVICSIRLVRLPEVRKFSADSEK